MVYKNLQKQTFIFFSFESVLFFEIVTSMTQRLKTTKTVLFSTKTQIFSWSSTWIQRVLLIRSVTRQPNGSILAELQKGQHFFVAILDMGGCGGGEDKFDNTSM